MQTDFNNDEETTRFAQVGFVMKAYRESFPRKDGRRGISQGDLLHRMTSSDPDYARRSSHSAVSKWESGGTPSTVKRLEAFGKAMNLSETEVEGLIMLAGLDPEQNESSKLPCPECGGVTRTVHVKKVQRTADEAIEETNTVRTRKCRGCRYTAETRERWLDDLEETDKDRMQHALKEIEEANNRIKLALNQVDALHHPQKPEEGTREDQSPADEAKNLQPPQQHRNQ